MGALTVAQNSEIEDQMAKNKLKDASTAEFVNFSNLLKLNQLG